MATATTKRTCCVLPPKRPGWLCDGTADGSHRVALELGKDKEVGRKKDLFDHVIVHILSDTFPQ